MENKVEQLHLWSATEMADSALKVCTCGVGGANQVATAIKDSLGRNAIGSAGCEA